MERAPWSDLRGRVDGDVGDRPNRVAGSAPLATRSENDCSGSRWGPISRSARAIQHACKRDYIRHIRTGCGFLQGNGARRISSGQVRSILLPDLLSHAEGSPVGIQVGGDRAPSGARPACLRCRIGVPCGQNAGFNWNDAVASYPLSPRGQADFIRDLSHGAFTAVFSLAFELGLPILPALGTDVDVRAEWQDRSCLPALGATHEAIPAER